MVSHSFRHTPIFGKTTSGSSKWYKKYIHHAERTKLRIVLKAGEFERAERQLIIYDDWSDPRDGKCWDNFKPQSGFGVHQRNKKYDENFYSKIKSKSMRK